MQYRTAIDMIFLELESVFNNEGFCIAFDDYVDLSGESINSSFEFKEPVHVVGEVKNETGIVKLRFVINVKISTSCDRCADEMESYLSFSSEHVLVTQLNDPENDEFLVVENMHFLLDDLVREDIFLEIPSQFLCRDDCTGLCPECGKNLNEGPCECTKKIDPRLAVLQQLLDGE